MTEFEGAGTFVTFKELSGLSVSVEEIISEIKRQPLDAILGYIAGLSLEMIQTDEDFFSPQLQGGYLRYAIVDDFPQRIPTAYKMYAPGRVPITGGRHIFIHEQNLAWLCHAALLHAKEEINTPKFTHELECRFCRLLLVINDLLENDPSFEPYNLIQRRNFTHAWLRRVQFNRFFEGPIKTLVKLARQGILLLGLMPRYYSSLESDFIEATGITLERYFQILTLFVTHLHGGMRKGNHWLSKNTVCSQIKIHRDEIEKMLMRWIRTPRAYRIACKEWRNERPDMGELPQFDFVPLRETPLIDARHDEFICPVPSFLFSKIEDEPFFIVSDFLSGQELTRFHVATGSAYEDYAHELVERIAKSDSGGEWIVKRSPRTKRGEQLADSYLQRGKVAILFEHKAQRAGTEFLRGREGDRVIGPSEEILKRLDNQETVSIAEGHSQDRGFMTRGMWQQSKVGSKMIEWAENEIGTPPTRLFPVITTLSSLFVDSVVRRAYLNPLIERAGLYAQEYWEKPQWLNVSDLESLAQLSDDGNLNLELLLQNKASESVDKRFDIFLYENEARYFDSRLHDKALSSLDSAALTFFKKRLTPETGPN